MLRRGTLPLSPYSPSVTVFTLRQGGRHRLDDGVDAFAPGTLIGRLAPTCRKARCDKSIDRIR
jgi:hypothetical protein